MTLPYILLLMMNMFEYFPQFDNFSFGTALKSIYFPEDFGFNITIENIFKPLKTPFKLYACSGYHIRTNKLFTLFKFDYGLDVMF